MRHLFAILSMSFRPVRKDYRTKARNSEEHVFSMRVCIYCITYVEHKDCAPCPRSLVSSGWDRLRTCEMPHIESSSVVQCVVPPHPSPLFGLGIDANARVYNTNTGPHNRRCMRCDACINILLTLVMNMHTGARVRHIRTRARDICTRVISGIFGLIAV